VSRFRALVCACLSGLVALLFGSIASAHQAGLSRGDYSVSATSVVAELVFARGELLGLARSLDENGDGTLSTTELEHGRQTLTKVIVDRLDVRAGEGPCTGLLDDVALLEDDGVSLRAVYRCPEAPQFVRIRLDLLDDLPFGHRHIARVKGATNAEQVLFGKTREIGIASAAPSGSSSKTPHVEPSQPSEEGFFGFVRLGVEHILFGYDHLVFLFGLVLVGGRLRAILLVITAFTLAHSITLGLAVLGVFAPSPRIVEPLIALSVAYVGVENFFVKDAEKRWMITFPFGLVHGFGFAGALGEIALPRPEIPKALLAFNLGVEAGQLAVLAAVLPLVFAARKKKWFEDKGVKGLSAIITALGVVWFVARIVSP